MCNERDVIIIGTKIIFFFQVAGNYLVNGSSKLLVGSYRSKNKDKYSILKYNPIKPV